MQEAHTCSHANGKLQEHILQDYCLFSELVYRLVLKQRPTFMQKPLPTVHYRAKQKNTNNSSCIQSAALYVPHQCNHLLAVKIASATDQVVMETDKLPALILMCPLCLIKTKLGRNVAFFIKITRMSSSAVDFFTFYAQISNHYKLKRPVPFTSLSRLHPNTHPHLRPHKPCGK